MNIPDYTMNREKLIKSFIHHGVAQPAPTEASGGLHGVRHGVINLVCMNSK